MNSTTFLIIILIVALVIFFTSTAIGKRLKLRAKGAAEEAIAEDASTIDGAKAYYNTAISKKETTYKSAYEIYVKINGEISSYESQLRALKKERIDVNSKARSCVERGNDDDAKRYLRRLNEIDEQVEIIREALKSLRETQSAQKEQLDEALEELNALKSEKDAAILKLQVADVTENLKTVPGVSDDEADKMLEVVREGVKNKTKKADGARTAYEQSYEVQTKRLDKQLAEEDLNSQLEEYKKALGKN